MEISKTDQDIANAPLPSLRPSRTAMKRDMERLQAIGRVLIDLPAGKFAKIDLPDKLRNSVTEARRLTAKGAQRRQLQYVGRIMEEFDVTAISRNLKNLDHESPKAKRAASLSSKTDSIQAAKQLAGKLLKSDDAALHSTLGPFADGQQLQLVRQWLRNFRKPRDSKTESVTNAKEILSLAGKLGEQPWWSTYLTAIATPKLNS